MAEITITDTQMILATIKPDGPVDGVPQWSVISGNGTLHSDPNHEQWDAALPDGYQMFLVSDTLNENEAGPLTTEYQVQADVDKGTGTELLTESLLLHVVNRTSTLGIVFTPAVAKP